MASISKRSGSYRALIRRKGLRPVSKTFSNKADALSWARQVEVDIERGIFQDITEAESTTLAQLMDRYETGILSTKRSQNSIRSQIKLIGAAIGQLSLVSVSPAVLSELRDRRLRTVGPETVRKDLSFLQRLFNTAMKDWGIHLPHGNPVTQVRFPSPPKGRDRRPTQEELDLLTADSTVSDLVCFAVETGMRRGEIASMKWEHINWDNSTLLIPNTKTGKPRRIPVSKRAKSILKSQNLSSTPSHSVWEMRPDSITQAFERACKRYGIKGLRFHDLRHEATSRFFEKGLNVMEVASITGHQDLLMLRRYTHIRPESLLSKLG